MQPIPHAQLETYSQNIYSDDKETRKSAREQIIRHTASFRTRVVLTREQREEFPNWHTVSSQIRTMIASETFPYEIRSSRAGEINSNFTNDGFPPISHSDFSNSNVPCYIVTMAHAPKLHLPNPLNHIIDQINLLWNEGFGADSAASQIEAGKRLAVVVGINYCHSLDATENKRYKQYIDDAFRRLSTPHVRIAAFNWSPVWMDGKKIIPQQRVKRLYRLLADAKPNKSKKIFNNLMREKSDFIPYQRIRNEIIRNDATTSFYAQMTRGHRRRPSFLVSWDDDAVRLRTEDMGIFSHYDQLIAQNPNVKVASTGYYMANEQNGYIELASRADLVARQAIAHTLPNGSYLSEVNIIIKISNPEDLKHKISFLREGHSKGKGLEFLGLLENLQLAKGNVNGRVVLGKKGAIQTFQPSRAKAACIPAAFTPMWIDTHLASLRTFCQTVLNPKKGFAASVARALPAGMGTAHNTAKISKIYTAFDPIDYSKSVTSWKRIYFVICNTLVKIYNKKIENENSNPHFHSKAKKIVDENNLDPLEKPAIKALLTNKIADIWDSRSLETSGALNGDQFQKLLIAAINTNTAVYSYLTSRINQTPFVFPELLPCT